MASPDLKHTTWDVLIKNALVFDGTGVTPTTEDIALTSGKFAARGKNLPGERAAQIVDAGGQWLMPGLIDIHTHLDLEVEVNPGLPEAVRHGTTTVVVGNCSIGAAFGKQEENGHSAIVDCFTRVENMPKATLQKCVDQMTWDNTADYLRHFEKMPLGPNIAPLIPHSMLRIAAMGLEASVSRAPTKSEMQTMQRLLTDALDQGYIGMSTDNLVFHYLANEPHKDKRIPTQFAEDRELKSLLDTVRQRDRVWQATPDNKNPLKTMRRFLWTSGRLYGKPLRVSALSALDFSPLPNAWRAFIGLAKFLNSPLLQGNFHFQALSSNFRIWADGVISPLFEELESTRQINACEAEDRAGRQTLLRDKNFQVQFKEEWRRLSVKFKLWPPPNGTFGLPPERMFVESCPIASWRGQSIASLFDRAMRYKQTGGQIGTDSDAEAQFYASLSPTATGIEDFFLQCLIQFDTNFRWWMDVANENKAIVKRILFDDNTLPGFNDSGAHIMNMAFYDGNLVTLKLAQEDGIERVAFAVKKLTRDPAAFFGLDIGTLDLGAQADVILIDPEALKKHDHNKNRQLLRHDIFEQDVLVNRSDGVVSTVFIKGTCVWENGNRFTPALGTQILGRALTYASR